MSHTDTHSALTLSTPLAPVRPRPDGWTPERQRAFLEALADLGCVRAAAQTVGMTPQSAYRLRRLPGAEAFAQAWESAIAHGIRRLTDVALARATDGVVHDVWHKGEIVGKRRVYSDGLLTFLLRHHQPALYNVTPDGYRPADRLRKLIRPFAEKLDEIFHKGDDA